MARVSLGSLVVGVVLGIALGFGAAVTFLAATDTSDPGDDGAHPGTSATPAESDEPASAAHRPADRARRAAADPFGDIAAGLPPIEDARGTGTFDGTVRDRNGDPVAGVLVRAEPNTPDDSFEEPDDDGPISPDEELRRDIRRSIAQHRLRVARLREANTGTDGRYRIEGVPDGRYFLRAEAAGWRIRQVGGGGGRDGWSPGATCDWIATRRLGFVAEVTGVPPGEDVDIWISERGQETVNWYSQRLSPATRRIDVAAGEHRVRAVAGEFDEWTSPWTDVTVAEDGPPPRVALALREARGFTGSILAAAGSPPVPFRIGLAKFRDGVAPPRSELLLGDRYEWARPGERFAFMDIGAGRWAVLVSAPGRLVLAEDVVDVGEDLTRRDFTLPPGDLGATIRVRVLGPDGKPVPDARFQTGFEATDGSKASGDVDPVPGAGGTWIVPHFERNMESNSSSSSSGGSTSSPDDGTAAAVKRRWIEVSSETYGTQKADYSPGDSEVVVRFQPAAFVEVELTGATPDAMRRVTVSVGVAGDDSRNWRHEAPAQWDGARGHVRDPDAQPPEAPGPIRLGPIPAGEVEIRAGITTGWGDAIWFHTVRPSLVAGTNRIRVTVPALQDLRVTAEAEAEGISLRAEGGMAVESTSESATAVVFRFLPPGRYTLSDWERGEMTVVIPGPAEVLFAPKPFDAFRVTELEHGGAAARAGVRDGDVVIAVNGRELSGRAQMQNVLSAAQLEEKVKLTVLRGGARLEIELPAAAMESMSLEETTR